MMKLNLTYISETKFIACIIYIYIYIKKKRVMGKGVGELFLHFNSFIVLVLLTHYNTMCATKLPRFLRIL